MNCQHWTRKAKTGPGKCAIGWFGGEPYVGNCLACLAKGFNNPEARESADAKAALTHPPHRDSISGCCDPISD